MTTRAVAGSSVSAPEGPAPELGEALRARAAEVPDRLVAQWRASLRQPNAAEARIEDGIRRSTLAGTLAVADYLVTGTVIDRDRSEEWDWTGETPLTGVITLSEITKLYLRWRRACSDVLCQEAAARGTGPETLEEALAVVQLGHDVSLVRMAQRFEVTRDQLEAQLVENQARLQHEALHDPLTGLANRVLLLDRLDHAIHAMRRSTTRPVVIFLDLDYFKSINDASGHSAGDQLLMEVGARLQSVVRPNDTIARLGGDEFVLLCEDLVDPTEEGLAVADRVAVQLESPFVIERREVFVAASMGIAPAAIGDTAEAVVARADQAMYRAKQLGRARAEVYDPAIDRQATRRAEVATALHHALGEQQLYVAYQPVVDIHEQRIVAREALLRWTHPALGNVGPAEFIPVAEETGVIVAIGRWVLGQACRDCADWRAAGTSDVGVAVNVSGRQLENIGFEGDVTEMLSSNGLAPDALTLEITESLLMAGRAEARGVLERLRTFGVRIAIDDFGTGYSSLSWLARLPLDVLKVDRSFISSLGLIERESAIVKAMIHLAHTLDLAVVAEGVETDSQLAQLTSLGCDEAQGFLLGYPEERPRA